MKVLHEIEEEMVVNAVYSKKSTFHDGVRLNGEIHGEKSKFTNREITYVVLLYYTVPVLHVKFNRKVNECFVVNPFTDFISILRRVNSQDASRKRLDAIGLHDLTCPGSAGAFFAQWHENSKIIKSVYATITSNDETSATI